MSVAAVVADSTERLIAAVETRTGKRRQRRGREWVLLCPAHDDHHPSLHVREGDSGYPLIRCRSHNCAPDAVLAAVNLSWSDVFGSDDERSTPRGPAVAIYDYVDEQGALIYQVCRTADKQFPQRRPDPSGRNGWIWNLKETRRVLYRLPEVLREAAEGGTVYVCEGEKDAQAIERCGFVATCSPGGAGKWREEYARCLYGANVVIIAHKDPAGYKHAREVAATLTGRVLSLKIVEAKDGNDAADHLKAGLPVDALVEVEIAALTSESLQEEQAGPAGDEEGAPRPRTLHFLPGEQFVKQPLLKTDPLVGTEDSILIAPKSFSMLAGIGGSGKTTLILHAIAHWASGYSWFGIPTPRPLRIAVIENEGPHDLFVKKVHSFCERFKNCPCDSQAHGNHFDWTKNVIFLDSPWARFSFENENGAADLNEELKAQEIDLLIANPLGRLGMKGVGAPDETRAFLDLMQNAGLGEDFAVMLIHHLAKPSIGRALVERVSGDWGPHADTILILERAAEKTAKLTFAKMRWGEEPDPMLLHWLTDKSGPVGYRTSAVQVHTIPDEDVYERIDGFLALQSEPVGGRLIEDNVKGKAARIRALLKQGVSEGRYFVSERNGRVLYRLTERTTGEPVLGALNPAPVQEPLPEVFEP